MGIGRWRHKDCLDMDLEIDRIRYVGLKYIVANVSYLNRNWSNGDFLIIRQKNVKIYKKDWPRWVRL